jgi:hypothetical protein
MCAFGQSKRGVSCILRVLISRIIYPAEAAGVRVSEVYDASDLSC